MFENAALNTDMIVTAKQAEILGSLVERDQVHGFVMVCPFSVVRFHAPERVKWMTRTTNETHCTTRDQRNGDSNPRQLDFTRQRE